MIARRSLIKGLLALPLADITSIVNATTKSHTVHRKLLPSEIVHSSIDNIPIAPFESGFIQNLVQAAQEAESCGFAIPKNAKSPKELLGDTYWALNYLKQNHDCESRFLIVSKEVEDALKTFPRWEGENIYQPLTNSAGHLLSEKLNDEVRWIGTWWLKPRNIWVIRAPDLKNKYYVCNATEVVTGLTYNTSI